MTSGEHSYEFDVESSLLRPFKKGNFAHNLTSTNSLQKPQSQQKSKYDQSQTTRSQSTQNQYAATIMARSDYDQIRSNLSQMQRRIRVKNVFVATKSRKQSKDPCISSLVYNTTFHKEW